MEQSAPSTQRTRKPALPVLTPTSRDWLFLAGVILFAGSSFSGIRIALETATPALVSAGRLWVAAILLIGYTVFTGRQFPPLLDKGRPSSVWLFALSIAATGYAGPMFLFPYAQQSVSSLLAGIYMAFMPIVTIILAALFAGEPLTRNKIIGTIFGLGGVLTLILPALPEGGLDASFIAQLALLLATTGYAVASILTRRAPQVAARSFGAMALLLAALLSSPAAIHSMNLDGSLPSAASILAILYLGILPTGVSTILIIQMVRSAGAGFLAVGNYATPGAAIIFGILLFGETLTGWHIIGLLTILLGVFVAQPGPMISLWQRLRTELSSKS